MDAGLEHSVERLRKRLKFFKNGSLKDIGYGPIRGNDAWLTPFSHEIMEQYYRLVNFVKLNTLRWKEYES